METVIRDIRQFFGRNFNINKDIRARYDKLQKYFIFKGDDPKKPKDAKYIFMLCLGLGYSKGRKKEVENPVGLLNTASFSDEDLWTITAIGVDEVKDIAIFNKNRAAEIKKIASEYAHTGLDELEQMSAEYGTGDNLELAIEKKARKALEKIEKT